MTTVDRTQMPIIGFVGLDLIYLQEDNPENHMKKVVIGEDSNNIVILGSVARFRPYDEVNLLDKSKWRKRSV